ncbi:MAG: RNA methyltransferase [Erysipelotrichaceae bacterium]|nr:RNA methyltransferase [Erysipelotrichaceae bacterium]
MMITSLENKTVKELTKLHQKKYREERFLILENDLIGKALRSGKLLQLIYTGEVPFSFENSLEVSEEVLDKIAGEKGRRYIGVSAMIEESFDPQSRVLLLDHLQDPLNIGRIMEASLHFGFDSLIMSKDCADIYNEKCLRNCYGGIYDLHICTGDLIEKIAQLKAKGFAVYATGLRNDTHDLYSVKTEEKMAFVLGNEGSGVTAEVMDACDGTIKIDMHNIDSLNVGMAASIIMYRFRT